MTPRTLSQLLDDLQNSLSGPHVSIASILEAFHERGFGFCLFLFALPAALPLPAVGLGTILAPPLLLLSAQMILGRHTVWFPARLQFPNPKSQFRNLRMIGSSRCR